MTPRLLWCGYGDNPMCWLFANRVERFFLSGLVLRATEKHVGSKKNPCCVPFITPHGFSFLTVRAVASGELTPAAMRHVPRGRGSECLYWSNRPRPNLCKKLLQTFADKLEWGCVRAKSAVDVPMLSSLSSRRSTGVAR